MRSYKVWIILFFTIILITLGSAFIIITNKNKTTTTHNYVATTVTGKYIEEGYAGWYVYKDDAYIIISSDNEGNEIETYVDIAIYNKYNIGDTIFYCKNHQKLEIYEK